MRAAPAIVNASLVAILALVAWTAAGPSVTDDLWWHLKMGEVYAAQGPWPDEDPLLHTAHEDAPVQHEWLFGVMLHALDATLGAYGLRAFHLLAVLGILGLADSVLRRTGAPLVLARSATLVFAVLAWPRLYQLRPDLVSIAATLVLFRLLLEEDRPASWRRVAAASGLLLVWANMHSLFAVGLCLLLAALLGLALEAVIARRAPGAPIGVGPRARRLGAALLLGIAASAANPRGFAQHLTFVTSSTTTGVWSIADEWTRFQPFSPEHPGGAVGLLAWLSTDLLLAGFFAAAVIGLWRPSSTRDRAGAKAFDGVAFGLGLAAIAALLVSVRFLWMGLFALLFLLHATAAAARRHPGASAGAAALASAALALAFPWSAGYRAVTSLQSDAGFAAPYVTAKYHVAGVRFLRDSRVQGNLFNPYNLGGFLGYWLSPRLRTFVDGRTEHYARDVLADYSAVSMQRGSRSDESHLDVLERRNVDLFVGTGVPLGIWSDDELFTAAHLEQSPAWMLVSRSLHHAIYLRRSQRNRANLRRVQEYYRREGVPFDTSEGFAPGVVIAERPDWAIRHEMLPLHYGELVAALEDPDPDVRFPALGKLALVHLLLGDYPQQLVYDAEARRLRPDAQAPLRRSVYSLLRLGRRREAADAAAALFALAGESDEHTSALRRLVREALASQDADAAPGGPAGVAAPTAALIRYPVLTRSEYRELGDALEPVGLEPR